MRVNRDDERAKLLHAALPQRLGHPQVALLGVLDLLDGGGGDDRVAGWEDAVQGAVRPAAGLGARVHTDLADDEAHAGAGEASRREVGACQYRG